MGFGASRTWVTAKSRRIRYGAMAPEMRSVLRKQHPVKMKEPKMHGRDHAPQQVRMEAGHAAEPHTAKRT